RIDTARELPLPLAEHQRDLLALQVFLRSAQRAWNERKLLERRIGGEIALAHVSERPDHDVAAVVGHELRRHRLQLAAEKEIEEKRGHQVVAVMAERDLGRAQLAGDTIEDAAAQAGAQRAHRRTLRDQALDD